jgi:hypothetical protein
MKVDNNNPVSRIAVFDMDETLGMFADLSEFTYTLARMLKQHSNYGHFRSNPDDGIQHHFNALMDLYPEVLRPKIMDIMKFLVQMKNLHKCEHVMIYTNNTGPREWTEGIKNYFNFKSKFELFDRVIGAFKRPNGEVVEVKRTSHDKTYSDLVRCTNLEGNFEVFFVDDRAHPGMHTSNVYVIEVKPYERRMPQSVFIERFMESPLFESLGFSGQESEFNKLLASSKRKTVPEYTTDEREVDLVVGDTILEKINWFFNPRHTHASSAPMPASGRKKSVRRRPHTAGRASASSAHRRTKRRGTGPSN